MHKPLEQAAHHLLDEAIAAVEPNPDQLIERRVVHDSPTKALIAESTDADLLVVGSRGRGGFTGLLLGSVSQQCASAAPCPVVIVGK